MNIAHCYDPSLQHFHILGGSSVIGEHEFSEERRHARLGSLPNLFIGER